MQLKILAVLGFVIVLLSVMLEVQHYKDKGNITSLTDQRDDYARRLGQAQSANDADAKIIQQMSKDNAELGALYSQAKQFSQARGQAFTTINHQYQGIKHEDPKVQDWAAVPVPSAVRSLLISAQHAARCGIPGDLPAGAASVGVPSPSGC